LNPSTTQPRRRWILRGTVVALAAAVLGLLIVPHVIRQAYDGESIDLLNQVITGQGEHAVEFYLAAWRRLFLQGVLALSLIVGLRIGRNSGPLGRLSRSMDAEPAWSVAFSIAFAAWVGALTGALEGTYAAGRFLIEHHVSREFQWEAVWMAPLAGALSFAVLACLCLLALRLVGWLARRSVPVVAVVFVTVMTAAISILLEPTFGLASYAVLILGAGLATVATRSARVAPARWRAACLWSSPILGALLVVTTIVGWLHLPSPLESRRIRNAPVARADAPNVLLIIWDTVRSSSMGLYGYGLPTTPKLDVRSLDGVVFDAAISPAPWTLPAHASLFTGRWSNELSTRVEVGLDGTYTTLAEVLSEHGYRTAGFVANYMNATESTGLQRGFARYEDFPVTLGRFLVSSWLSRQVVDWIPRSRSKWRLDRKEARETTDDFLRWRQALTGERPYFAFLNYIDAHSPYLAPDQYRRLFPSERRVVLPLDGVGMSPEELDGTRAAYDANIRYMDTELDRLLERLGTLDADRGTLVILTSDHGEFFGEHRLVEHGGALYDPVVHVPLLIIHEGVVPPGLRIRRPVSTRDLAATITDVVLGSTDDRLGGMSLASLWESTGAAPPESGVLAEVTRDDYEWVGQTDHDKSIFYRTMHYIRSGDGGQELYDLEVDPDELHDLSRDPEFADVLSRLDLMTDRVIDRGSDRRPVASSSAGGN